MEPRGVREYASGDSLRHIHWASTAKRGQLLVKEFEAGSHTAASIVIQQSQGSELGKGADTTLERMCGNAVFLAEHLMSQGALVQFPTLEGRPNRTSGAERVNEIYEMIARVKADRASTISSDIFDNMKLLPAGSILIVLLSVADPGLMGIVRQMRGLGIQVVAILYADESGAKAPPSTQLATELSYMDELESAGALVRIAEKGGDTL
jgi:uncharacterized protein (DUF58 family)